jgi:uncharacterized protein (UPF0332 family)
MIDEQSRTLSMYRFSKARNVLVQAELLLSNHQYDGSVNRSYYAMFTSVRAVLALVQLDSRSHQGVISFFDRYFVKTNLFEKQYSQFLHTAFDVRQDNDYEDFYVPSATDAQEQYDHACQLLQEIEKKCQLFLEGKLSLPTISS